MILSLYIINATVQTLIMVSFFINTLETKYSVVKTAIIFVTIQMAAYFLTLPVQDNLLVKGPISSLVLTLSVIYLTKSSGKKKAIVLAAFHIITIFCELISVGWFLIFHNITDIVFDFDEIRLITALNFSIIYLSLLMIFTVFWNKIEGYIKYKLLLLLILFPAYQIMLITGMYYYNEPVMYKNIFLFSSICQVIIIAANYIMYNTISNLVKYIEDQQELEFLKNRSEFQYNYYQLATENTKELSLLKHDFSNQLQTAYVLFLKGEETKRDGLRILNALQERMQELDEIIHCNNPIINTVLALKTAEARKLNINTDIRIEPIIKTIISEMDLCSIFSNLYDNAIESCLQIVEGSKEIIIRAAERKGYLVIKFSNTYNGVLKLSPNGEIETIKKDKKQHGKGLNILKAIAEKYDGDFMVKAADGRFEAMISIKSEL